jgi:hypothetical protein
MSEPTQLDRIETKLDELHRLLKPRVHIEPLLISESDIDVDRLKEAFLKQTGQPPAAIYVTETEKKPRNRFTRLIPWRWFHKCYAAVLGYFWIPCPQCGEDFGGHEAAGSVHLNGKRQLVCAQCTKRHPRFARWRRE